MAYVNYTLDEWIWKAGNNRHFENTKLTAIDSSKLDDMQESMRRIIQTDNDNELAMFGSFFFVADSRGIKKSTSVLVQSDGCPYQSLCKNYPSMDFEYMMKRENGQLLMDLGMAFHPNPRDKEPRIGLWRLDRLQGSYAAAGLKTGTVHHFNTLMNYGGMQSEMTVARAGIVQLVYRQSYNLIHEIVRRPGEPVYFCEDSDAYNNNYAFASCLDDFQTMYLGSFDKSFGVREEMRGSGIAIKQFLIDAPRKVMNPLSF